MKNITLTIDGNLINCPNGTSILEAAEGNGIKIPKLCYHQSLKPYGACRLCLVEDENSGRLMASCVTPAAQDMVILTNSPKVNVHRRNIVRLMMAEHPESCIVCNKGNRCQLRMIAAQLGIGETGLYSMHNYKAFEQGNPFIVRDLSKCILCGKCIRADHELVVAGAIDYNLRGFKSRPATVHDLPLEKSTCTFCGTCVSLCPTGALTARGEYAGTPEGEFNTICGFCSVGCSLTLGVSSGKVVEVNPGYLPKSVNNATLCVRGHFAHDFLNSTDRLTQPLARTGESSEGPALSPVSWDDAMDIVAKKLMETKSKHGPESIAFLGSSKCTNEENYLFQKIARTIVSTNNIDSGGYVSGRQLLSLIEKRTDAAGRFNFFAGPLTGLEKAEVIFVIGADPDQSTPVVSYYIKRAAVNGVPVVIADPRKTELARFSSVWLPLVPGTDLELVNNLCASLTKEKAVESSFISRFANGFTSFRESLDDFDFKQSAEITGIDEKTLEKAVDIIKGKKISFVIGNGILKQKYGRESLDALLNLAMATGSIGYEGSGFHVLSKENNMVGAWDMGSVPDTLPGRLSLSCDSSRQQWEKVWGQKIPEKPGLDAFQILKAVEKGTLKALYIMGENPLRSFQQSKTLTRAFQNLEFIVAQDILDNETTRIAHVVLPGAAFSEKEGSFTSMEGRINRFTPAVLPPGKAMADLDILGRLANKLENTSRDYSIEQIREEIGRVIPCFSKATGKNNLVWIRVPSDKSDTDKEKNNQLISFSKVMKMKNELHDAEFPFTAILGSSRFHLGSGTRTSRSARISEFDFMEAIELSIEDAEKLGVENGDRVSVISQSGEVDRSVRISGLAGPGLIFVPLAYKDNDAAKLIPWSPLFDPSSESWISSRVKLEKR